MKYDIVYMWVDSNDPLWQSKKQQYMPPQKDLVAYANDASRFRNNDELYYSLKSMRRYAKDVRNIYLVSDDQIPVWINEFPEIILIDHTDILECTPVFNTRAILNQLHKIDGILDHFIIMNDDIFFNKNMYFNDFFHKNHDITVFIEQDFVNIQDMRAHHSRVLYVQDILGVPCRYVLAHAAIPIYKPQYMALIHQYEELYHRVNHQRYRQNSGVSIQHLYHYHVLYRSPWCAHIVKHGYYETHTLNEHMYYTIKKDTSPFICINDTWSDDIPEQQRYWLSMYYRNM